MDFDLQIFERQEPTSAKKKENQKFWFFSNTQQIVAIKLATTTSCGKILFLSELSKLILTN